VIEALVVKFGGVRVGRSIRDNPGGNGEDKKNGNGAQRGAKVHKHKLLEADEGKVKEETKKYKRCLRTRLIRNLRKR
jgi:hypothetical protein